MNFYLPLIATGSTFNDAVHITAIVGESVVFNCQVEFPAEHPVPYVLQWEKKVSENISNDYSVNTMHNHKLVEGTPFNLYKINIICILYIHIL